METATAIWEYDPSLPDNCMLNGSLDVTAAIWTLAIKVGHVSFLLSQFSNLPQIQSSGQCIEVLSVPPNSCRNLIILAESSGIKFGRKACYFFSFQCLLFWWNLGIPELRLECSMEFAGMESGCLFVCLFVCFTPVTKQTTNQTPCDVVSFCHPPPPPLLPPHQRHPQ